MMKPTVFVVDDDDSVRLAVEMILESAGHQIESYTSAVKFLAQFDPTRSGCLVSDVRMPGMDGMELLKRLSDQDSQLPVLLLTGHGDVSMAVSAMKMGAVDFLEKPVEADDLRERVAIALAKDATRRCNEDERCEIMQLLSTLTSRERQILELIINGKSAKIIAKTLGNSYNTVRVQRASIMKKLQADSDADIVRMMSMVGLLDV